METSKFLKQKHSSNFNLMFALTDIIIDIINLLLHFCWQKPRLIAMLNPVRKKKRKGF